MARTGRPPTLVPAGARFGKLTVTRDRVGSEKMLQVRCDCGTEKAVSYSNLVCGTTRSCGAHARQPDRRGSKNGNYRHGHSPAARASSTYDIWAQVVQRTTNPKAPRWKDYGGRGIDLDPRWRRFDAFLADMGERPESLSIERIDNNKGYWPDNCTWATATEQRRNRRDTAK